MNQRFNFSLSEGVGVPQRALNFVADFANAGRDDKELSNFPRPQQATGELTWKDHVDAEVSLAEHCHAHFVTIDRFIGEEAHVGPTKREQLIVLFIETEAFADLL